MNMRGATPTEGEVSPFHNSAMAVAAPALPALQPLSAEDMLWKEAEARGLLPSVSHAKPIFADGIDFEEGRPVRPRELPRIPANGLEAIRLVATLSGRPVFIGAARIPDEFLAGLSQTGGRILILTSAPSGAEPAGCLAEPVREYLRAQSELQTFHRALSPKWAELLEETQAAGSVLGEIQQQNRTGDEILELIRRELEGAAGDLPLRVNVHGAQVRTRTALDRTDLRLREVGEESERQRSNRQAYAGTIELMKPFAEARQHLRWWTPGFWKSLFQRGLMPRWNQLHKDLAAAGSRERELEAEAARLRADADRLRLEGEGEVAELLQAELQARLRERDERLLALRNREAEYEARLDQCWDCLCRSLDFARERPTTIEGIRGFQEPHIEQCDQTLHETAWAEGWLRRFSELPRGAAVRRLMQSLPTVEIALDDLRSMPRDRTTPRFDWILLRHAGTLGPADLSALSSAGQRLIWICTADAAERSRPMAARNGKSPTGASFDELYERANTSCWREQGPCRSFQLEPLTVQDRSRIEWEPLFDRPQIQLGILPPFRHHSARLVEVRFPVDYPIPQAKQILFDELQTISLQTSSPGYCISAEGDAVVVRLMECPSDSAVTIGKGIEELVCGLETVAIRFATASGWNVPAVRSWLNLHFANCPVRRAFSL